MFVGSRTYRPSLWARLFLSKNWKLKLDVKRRDRIQITGSAELDCMEINSVATTSGILWSTVQICANGRVETLSGLSGDSAKQLQADIIGFINLHLGDQHTDLLHINDEFSASLVIVRCQLTAAGSLRWKVRLDQGLRPDITIAARMSADNTTVRDYYLLPWIDLGSAPNLRLAPYNHAGLDAYRVDDLDGFVELTRRTALRAA